MLAAVDACDQQKTVEAFLLNYPLQLLPPEEEIFRSIPGEFCALALGEILQHDCV